MVITKRAAAQTAVPIAALAAMMVLAGCSVNVSKDSEGQNKDVSIHTPFGGVQVHDGDKGGVVDTGLPVYPGAALAPKEDGNGKSVDMQVGFGPWQVRVQVASYISSDPEASVQSFYKKALGAYGDVLTCHGSATVGTPTRTSAGLTCRDSDDNKHFNVTHGVTGVTQDADLELKAGSERTQHVVAFESKKHPGTHFALISLSLPGSGSHLPGKGDSESNSSEE